MDDHSTMTSDTGGARWLGRIAESRFPQAMEISQIDAIDGWRFHSTKLEAQTGTRRSRFPTPSYYRERVLHTRLPAPNPR